MRQSEIHRVKAAHPSVEQTLMLGKLPAESYFPANRRHSSFRQRRDVEGVGRYPGCGHRGWRGVQARPSARWQQVRNTAGGQPRRLRRLAVTGGGDGGGKLVAGMDCWWRTTQPPRGLCVLLDDLVYYVGQPSAAAQAQDEVEGVLDLAGVWQNRGSASFVRV